jgi:hypothetical protein
MFPFDGIAGRIVAKLLHFYNRRLAVLARKRLAAGTYGARNAGWRLLVPGFTHEPGQSGRLLLSGIWRWVKMEIGALRLRDSGPRAHLSPAQMTAPSEPVPAPASKG